ncbi:MAG: glycosyltransferase family 4 protein [Anaerolineales bacterium]|nr:glycosyltransferase family 4 protein [Anaerolineales bacterium]
MTKHIVMFLTNAYQPDTRVQREAYALAEAGYQVTIICWDRQKEFPAREQDGAVHIHRVHDVPSAYGSGWRQLFYLPRFWRRAIQIGRELQPDAVHCHDLDTLYIGRQLKRQLNIPLVYDAHEHYPALMSLYLPPFMVWGLVKWEQLLMSSADHIFTASTVLQDEFKTVVQVPVQTIGNYANLHTFAQSTEAERLALRSRLDVREDQLLVAFIAKLSRNRQIIPLIEAAALVPDVEFHLWGDGLQKDEVEAAVANYPNAQWHGWINPSELPVYFHAADVMYYCLRTDYQGAIYNAPNTLSQAMSTATPIIANRVGDLGRIVSATNCGLLLDEVTPEAIALAVEQLKDPQLRQMLGQNGQAAAQEQYNDAFNAQILGQAYQSLIG